MESGREPLQEMLPEVRTLVQTAPQATHYWYTGKCIYQDAEHL